MNEGGPLKRVVQGESLTRFTNENNRGSRITDMKISFSRITKRSKLDILFNDLILH